MRYKGTKAKAWEAMRKLVAKRDGKNCYTCHRSGDGYMYDTGHYLPVALVGSNNSLSWDVRLIHAQCKFCNGPGQGMQVEYRKHLVKDYGEEIVLELEARRWKVDPVKDWDVLMATLKEVS